MRTLLIGCGAVGIGIAASLYDSQVPLDLVARGETKKAIELKGIKRTGLLKEVTIPAEQIQIYETIKEIQNKSFDVILICTKTTQSEGIFMELSEAPHLLAAGGKIVLVQNGLDDEEMVLKYFKKQQVYSARVFIGFTRPELQISEVTVFSSGLLIGNLYGCEIEGLLPLALAIDQGGMPCKVVADIAKNIWAKMLYNCALNPLGAILGANYGALLKSEHTLEMMKGIIEEVFAVMLASGHKTFWPDAKAYQKSFIEKIVPPTAEHRSSTLQDIERQMKTEIDSLTGAIIELGHKHGVPVPYNEMIFHLIKSIEGSYAYAKS